MDFIAGGLVDLVVGVSAAIVLVGFRWWAALLLALAWLSTHWLLRESGVWKDRNTDEVRKAQRHAEYSYRLAVDAAPAKELRFFGLAGWVTDLIVVMDGSRVAEFGSHEDLMARNGQYAELFRIQAAAYG